MSFPNDEQVYGPQSYGRRKGTQMAVFHTTEGAGPSRADALATVKLQSPGGPLYAGGGSYHYIIYDGGILNTVHWLDSAGSLMGDHSQSEWQPVDWLDEYLTPAAMADTNAYIVAICFSGKARELEAGKYPGNMFDTAARLLRWLELQDWAPNDIPTASHSDFQSNRSDPGEGVVDKVIGRYGMLYSSREDLLESEVKVLREQFPDAAARWVRYTNLTIVADGRPLKRVNRLSAEAMYLREVRKAAG